MRLKRPILWGRKFAQNVDRLSVEKYGIDELALMERAGEAVARNVLACLAPKSIESILVLAGSGNNGGDALVAARHVVTALGSSFPIHVCCFDEGALTESCLKQRERLLAHRDCPNTFSYTKGCLHSLGLKTPLILDGVLGIGCQGSLREGPYKEALTESAELAIASEKAYVIAIDLPSGFDCDRWHQQAILKSQRTVTFGALKPCHAVAPAKDQCGEVICEDIGFAEEAIKESHALPHLEQVTQDHPLNPWSQLSPSSHKYDRGHLLVIGGSMGKMGAPIMSGLASLRAGFGWASLAVPPSQLRELYDLPPELTFEDFFAGDSINPAALKKFIEERRVKAVVVGPGTMGPCLCEAGMEVLSHFSKKGGFVVFDAGATQGLGELQTSFAIERTIALPHPGEWNKLRSPPLPCEELAELEPIQALARKLSITLCYKSATPMIFSGEGTVQVCTITDRRIGKAGSGDIIAGLCGAFGGTGMPANEAFVNSLQFLQESVELCSLARNDDSLIASDLLDHLGRRS